MREPLVTTLLVLYALTCLSVIIYSGYFNNPFWPSVSFRVDDGWCDPSIDGLGLHCFGDFSDVYSKNFQRPWNWVAPFSHPPLSQFIQAAFGYVSDLTGSKRLALGVWLAVSSLAMLVPAIWAGWGRKPSEKALALVLVGVGSTPFLITFDRGNTTSLLVPLVFLFAWALLRDRNDLAVWAIVFATLLRPQALLLVAVFMVARKWRHLVYAVVGSLAGLTITFLIYPGDRALNFSDWFHNVTAYGNYSDPFRTDGANLSILRSVALVLQVVSSHTGGGLAKGDVGVDPSFASITGLAASGRLTAVLVLTLGALYALLLWKRGRRLTTLGSVTLAISLVVIVPDTSFAYYAVLFLTPAALALRGIEGNRLASSLVEVGPSFLRVTVGIAFIAAMAITLVPLALPLSVLLPDPSVATSNLSAHLMGPAWLLVTVLMTLAMAIPNRWAGDKDSQQSPGPRQEVPLPSTDNQPITSPGA